MPKITLKKNILQQLEILSVDKVYFAFWRLAFFLTISFSSLSAQTIQAIVKAPSGMNVRENPGMNGKVLQRVLYGDTIRIHSEKLNFFHFDKIDGHWRKMSLKSEVIGYVWDGYLELLEENTVRISDDSIKIIVNENSDTLYVAPFYANENRSKYFKHPLQLLLETYNYCGDVKDIEIATHWWWAFIPSDNGIIATKTNINIKLSENRLSSQYEFDISTDLNERSVFIIGYPVDIIDEDPTPIENPEVRLQNMGRKILPGNNFALNEHVSLFALGNVVDVHDDCPDIKDYKLFAKIDSEKINLLDLIPKKPNHCVIPDLYFYGDINGNGIPEMIFVFSNENENIFYLLGVEAKSKSYKLQGVFEMKHCD
jgi:hypothetical protein